MNTETSKYPDSRSWKQFYRAAILENDDSRLPQRVAEAEQAIVARARELFQTSGDHIEEQESLDDAMYALHALESSWRHRATSPAGISALPRSTDKENGRILSWNFRNTAPGIGTLSQPTRERALQKGKREPTFAGVPDTLIPLAFRRDGA